MGTGEEDANHVENQISNQADPAPSTGDLAASCMVPTSSSSVTPASSSSSSIDALARKVQDSLALGQRHRFWETQPVGQFRDLGNPTVPEGPIEPLIPLSDVKRILTPSRPPTIVSPLGPPPPAYFKAWHIGVRIKSSKKLVAFITGVPARIRVRNDVVGLAEINFLCVHKKLRSKRLAPVMIKEVTRRVHLENMWQAAYTVGVVLPTLITTTQYWHRSLNPMKLIEVGFSRLGPRMTMSRTIKLYKLPDPVSTPGFRKMELRDVPALVVGPDFEDADVEHWLLPKEDVVESYVVECPQTYEVTDFCSFYTLPSSILSNQNCSVLKAAYSYYNVAPKTPLLQLMDDAVIVAKQKEYDVFNALGVMHNRKFLKELKFGPGDGQLPTTFTTTVSSTH
ncbi:unnamed protein product [Spirodela intermedia]|uniref:Glycylpeptide N-tetradecanoyltransferase n=1 Tax=Spirodela intermedia TaxID=51605 RepID=A0A7I8JBS6_SPIIN|nr:unnamed protein product [Spirodela intermedia]CAA6667544.1 unnamed protein product [Spirodela intermedia]